MCNAYDDPNDCPHMCKTCKSQLWSGWHPRVTGVFCPKCHGWPTPEEIAQHKEKSS